MKREWLASPSKKEQRHLGMSSHQKLHKAAREEEATTPPTLGFWKGNGKSIFTQNSLQRELTLPSRFLSLMYFHNSIISELCSPCPCWVFVKHPVRLEQSTFLRCRKNILAKRDNAKAERAKIRLSGVVWLGSCVHRLLTWPFLPASLPALGLLRAQCCFPWHPLFGFHCSLYMEVSPPPPHVPK